MGIFLIEYAFMTKSIRVPNTMKDRYKEIIDFTDKYSSDFLNDEYAHSIRLVTAALCRKKSSPLIKGKTHVWACAVIHAVGMVNFLFDKNNQPFVRALELYEHFDVSSSNGSAKSKQIRDLLDMYPLCDKWVLPSLRSLQVNPIWFSFDVRILGER